MHFVVRPTPFLLYYFSFSSSGRRPTESSCMYTQKKDAGWHGIVFRMQQSGTMGLKRFLLYPGGPFVVMGDWRAMASLYTASNKTGQLTVDGPVAVAWEEFPTNFRIQKS